MRRLVAVLACRMESSRLYAKPLQRLCEGVSILDQILATLSRFPCIHQVVLGISRKPGNGAFKELASKYSAGWVWGDPDDVLGRVISCGKHAEATDIFHVTSENPFLCHEMVEEACEKHLRGNDDVTVLSDVPDGTGFDIYRLESLKAAHRAAEADEREHVSRFIKRNLEDFSINLVAPLEYLRRPDLRFTVDYPEDLIFCRAAYRELRGFAPLIPLKELIAFADAHPEMTALVAPYSAPALPWKIREEAGS